MALDKPKGTFGQTFFVKFQSFHNSGKLNSLKNKNKFVKSIIEDK